MRNAVGREIPERIEGYRSVKPFTGAFDNLGIVTKAPVRLSSAMPGKAKVVPNIRAALHACELKDGAIISFHHHLRNGDYVLNMVLEEIARMGLKDIKVAASSLFPVHAPVVEYFGQEVVTGIHTAYISGPVADAISRGALKLPAIMHTHGGRARAIESGDLHIDVAFVAAPTADVYGNINGVEGKSACGTLGYAMVDVMCADRVVAITDNLVRYPACPIDISQDYVDYVVKVDSIGDPQGIVCLGLRGRQPIRLASRSRKPRRGLLRRRASSQTNFPSRRVQGGIARGRRVFEGDHARAPHSGQFCIGWDHRLHRGHVRGRSFPGAF
jgi:citrate lyase subunit alpha/citrate CoA-transferase